MKKLIAITLVLVALLGLTPAEAATAGVTVYADPAPPASITVDGVINAEEWGEPAAVYSYKEVAKEQADWTVWRFFGSDADMNKQSLELYVRRDDTALYFAFRFVNIHHIDYGYTDKDGWRYAGMKFALGAYNPDTFIENGQKDGSDYEKWLSYTFRNKYNEDADTFSPVISAGGSIGFSQYKKPNAAIRIDEDNYSYNYEVILPYADLYGVITAETENLALSYEMTDARVAGFDSGNRWFISQAVRKATEGKDPKAFYNSNPLLVTFAEKPVEKPPVQTPEPEVPEETEPAAPSSWYWIIPIIALAAAAIAVTVVIVIKRSRKENQK